MSTRITLRQRIGLVAASEIAPNTIIWDTDVKGFCIRRQRSAVVSYLLKLRIDGRIRWVTIGRHGQPWTPTTARSWARAILADRSLAEPAPREKPVTFSDLADRFLTDHGPKLRLKTLSDYQGHLRNYLLPAFAPLLVADITFERVAEAVALWRDTPRAANYALSVLSKIMTWSEQIGFRPRNTNPCRGIQRYREGRRQTAIQHSELERLSQALADAEALHLASPFAIAAIRLLMVTGRSPNEILTLRWSEVDLQSHTIVLHHRKRRTFVSLSDTAAATLAALPRFPSNEFVIIGRSGGHLVSLQKPWLAIRTLANLPHLRLQDLRHLPAAPSSRTAETAHPHQDAHV